MVKLTKEKFLAKINSYIAEQNGKVVTLDSRLIDSEMDSFDYAFFWAYVEEDFPMFTQEYIMSIDYNLYTINDMAVHYENN